jgi:hypothetical protein
VFPGYLALGGVEIVNSARTEAYIRNEFPQFPLKDCQDCDDIHEALVDQPYESPLIDDAPWVDANNPATLGFYGLYPLAIEGVDDDTFSADVVESITDGATIGAGRSSSREMRVRGLLIARDRLSLHAGMAWLKAALYPVACADHSGGCGGAVACMFAACPQIESCWKPSVQVGEMIPTGSISPMSPFFATWPEPVDTEDGLQTALKNINFEIPQTDGAIVQWGSSSLDQSVIYEAHGPIVSLRTNSVTNPSFANNTSGWTPTAGTIARVAAGGVDGGAYGHFDATGAAKLQSPLLDGWFGQVTSSFALRVTGTVTVSIVAADDGAVISTQVVSLLADWERTYLGANYGRDVFLEFTGTDDFDIDQVMLEAGPTELPYFDGSIAPYDPLFLAEPIGHYVMAWTATAGNSVSTMHWLGEVDWTPTPGTQALALKESCDPAFRVYLMTTAGTIPSGMMNVGLREGIPPSIQARTYQSFFQGV